MNAERKSKVDIEKSSGNRLIKRAWIKKKIGPFFFQVV